MLPFIAPPEEEIARAFSIAVLASPLKPSRVGQLTITFKNAKKAGVLVYDYQTIVGKSRFEFRTEGTLRTGLESKARHFVIIGDGKQITLFDREQNLYSRATPEEPGLGFYVGLLTLLALNNNKTSAVAHIADPQAKRDALALLPQLMGQEGGLLSLTPKQQSSGRYSLVGAIKVEERSGDLTLTLAKNKKYVERLHLSLAPVEGDQLTLTDTVADVSTVSTLPLFTFKPPLGAQKVPELPPLLPQ